MTVCKKKNIEIDLLRSCRGHFEIVQISEHSGKGDAELTLVKNAPCRPRMLIKFPIRCFIMEFKNQMYLYSSLYGLIEVGLTASTANNRG